MNTVVGLGALYRPRQRRAPTSGYHLIKQMRLLGSSLSVAQNGRGQIGRMQAPRCCRRAQKFSRPSASSQLISQSYPIGIYRSGDSQECQGCSHDHSIHRNDEDFSRWRTSGDILLRSSFPSTGKVVGLMVTPAPHAFCVLRS
jgi:hypothetical protein